MGYAIRYVTLSWRVNKMLIHVNIITGTSINCSIWTVLWYVRQFMSWSLRLTISGLDLQEICTQISIHIFHIYKLYIGASRDAVSIIEVLKQYSSLNLDKNTLREHLWITWAIAGMHAYVWSYTCACKYVFHIRRHCVYISHFWGCYDSMWILCVYLTYCRRRKQPFPHG